jgi:hypothetical protein
MKKTNVSRFALVLLTGLGTAACAQSSLRISPDFGKAVSQDVVAQIADPDAHYEGTPAPGSNSARVGLAQKRYESNQVIPPSSVTASGGASIGQADNGSSAGSSPGTGK